ncbi:MAG: hypothetical protein J3Q66DRAFT_330978 [Benniella sp.]|nr:MAG: hypothetical protein J3Q66DRAFT_330978 [Benniella sp.]
MEKITPFDIPLLNNEICQYLSHKDLTRCVLVSKAWAGWFSPALWRELDCHNKTLDILILTRQQEHIRTVRNIPMECDRPMREQLARLRLQRLEIDEMSGSLSRPIVRTLRLLERIPTLQHLQITLPLDLDPIHQQWMRTIEALPCLESLTLECPQLVNGMVLLEILQACRGLQCLSLTLDGDDNEFEEEERQEYEDAREAIRRMPPMRLCELTFSSYAEVVEENILQPLFERCPRMEKLRAEAAYSRSTLEHLIKTLRENKLPELRHLILASFKVASSKDKLFDELMSSIARGLESFGFDRCGETRLVQFLIRYHSRSLARLDLLKTPIELSTLSDLMAGLPYLRTVKAKIDQNQYRGDILPFNRDWRCVGMRSLELVLGMCSIWVPVHGWKKSTEKACLDHVFSQVGKLRSLQELKLGCQLDMYCKKGGYLEKLADLKQLKVLDLTDTVHQNFYTYHALWMANNWPKLLQIQGKGFPAVFKKTLWMKRPLLEIVSRMDDYDDNDDDYDDNDDDSDDSDDDSDGDSGDGSDGGSDDASDGDSDGGSDSSDDF